MYATLNNGVKFPMIGFGTFLLRSPYVEPMVEAAINEGCKLIDTAAVYKNEQQIGTILNNFIPNVIQREDIFITSKLGPASQGDANSLAAATTSIKDLDLEYLDLYLIHWPGTSGLDHKDPQNKQLRKESWLQLEKLYKKGLFKAIGVSNYTVEHIEELLEYCSVVPAVLQIEVHPYLTQRRILQFCNQHGIHVQAYSSLGSGKGCQELLSDPVVQDISKSIGKTCAQVLLKWALQHNMSVIPKTSNIDRLKENLAILDFDLNSDHMKALDALDKGLHYCWNPDAVV